MSQNVWHFVKHRLCPLLLLIALLTLFVALGSLTTLISKFQNEFFVKEGQLPPQPFYHPLLQTLCVMIGYCGVGIVAMLGFCRKGELKKCIRKRASTEKEVEEEDVANEEGLSGPVVGGVGDETTHRRSLSSSLHPGRNDEPIRNDVEMIEIGSRSDSLLIDNGSLPSSLDSPAPSSLQLEIGRIVRGGDKEGEGLLEEEERIHSESDVVLCLGEGKGVVGEAPIIEIDDHANTDDQQEKSTLVLFASASSDDEEGEGGDDDQEEEREKQQQELRKPDLNLLLLLLPAVCNIAGNIIIYVGLLYAYAAVYEMMLSLIVIYSAIISIIFFRRCPSLAEWLGIGMIVIGAGLVGSSSVLFGSETRHYSVLQLAFGNGCFVIGMLGFALEYAFQEIIMKKEWANVDKGDWITSPTTVVWFEGLWGLPVALFACLVGTLINFDNVPRAVLSIKGPDAMLGFWIFALIACLGTMNWIGVVLTDRVSATYRAVLGCLRMVVVWAVQLMRGRDTYHWMRLLGMIAIAVGNVIYTIDLKKVLFWCKGRLCGQKAGSPDGQAISLEEPV